MLKFSPSVNSTPIWAETSALPLPFHHSNISALVLLVAFSIAILISMSKFRTIYDLWVDTYDMAVGLHYIQFAAHNQLLKERNQFEQLNFENVYFKLNPAEFTGNIFIRQLNYMNYIFNVDENLIVDPFHLGELYSFTYIPNNCTDHEDSLIICDINGLTLIRQVQSSGFVPVLTCSHRSCLIHWHN